MPDYKAPLPINPPALVKKADKLSPSDRERQILEEIRMLESSNNPNVEHRVIDQPDSIHYGDQAVGLYGLMPNTVDYILKKAAINKQITPEMQEIQALPENERINRLNTNPSLQDQMALKYLRSLMQINPKADDEDLQLHWKYGPKDSKTRLKQRTEDERAKRFRELRSKVKK